MRKNGVAGLVGNCALLASLTAARSADAQWTFTKIADTGTTVPGSATAFGSFQLPAIHNGLVSFAGFSASTAGIYARSGGPLSVVADLNTPAPAGGNFTWFLSIEGKTPSVHAGQVAFLAGSQFESGVFLRSGGTITPIVTNTMQVPNAGGATFNVFGQPSLQNGRIVLAARASGDAQRGVYSSRGGALSVLADRTTVVPGQPGTFTDFFDCDIDQGRVVFSAEGQSEFRGLCRTEQGGSLARLYDSTTVVPGGNGGTFTFLSRVASDADHVAFWALGGDQEGFYCDVGGTLGFVVHDGSPSPSVPGAVFTGYGDIALDSGVVAFQANLSNGNIGVYSTHTGSVQKVANLGDIIDGKLVQMAFMGPESLDGNSIAVKLVFSGTPVTEGIYIATIDLPCYPDCNADGALTVADFGCFQSRFVLQLPYADCNHDAVLTVADFGCFQTKFVTGCP